jgi:pentatricopeptide repeat protein
VEAEIAAMAPGTVQLNIFSWNKRLARCVKAGQYEKTIELFQQLQQEGVSPDKFTFVPVLNACANLRALQQGRHVHEQIIQSGCQSDVFLGSSLANMYVKCGRLEDAWRVFNKMPSHDMVSWNVMIVGHVKSGKAQKALELFQQMQQEGVKPGPVTFAGILNACASVGALEEGRHVHKEIIENGCESDGFVGNSLIDMYVKCGSMEDAWRVFNRMPLRDVVSWTSMLLGHVKSGQGQKALELYRQMQLEGVQPDSVTFVGVLNACASLMALEKGRLAHEQIIQSGCELDVFVGSSLVDMYVKCGSMEEAWRVFKKMPSRDVVSWNVMIMGHVKCGQGHKALELFQQMQLEGVQPGPVTFVGVLNACASLVALEEGRQMHKLIIESGFESNIFVGNSLLDMYVKCGSMEDAWRVFKKMPSRDVVSWNVMILGHVKCGQGQKALELSRQMQLEGVQPDPITFVGVLNACASTAALNEGRRTHEQIVQSGYDSNVFVGNSLVDMYAKCGSMEEAWRVFKKMPSHDVVSWNVMILGHVKCGQGQKALELFQEMQLEGVPPSPVTFVGFLNACASVLALEEGRCTHEQIIQSGCESDIFVQSSLIDMYAKCGSMEEAWSVFKKMPSCHAVAWTAMLNGYAIHGHGQEAIAHFEQMCEEGVELDNIALVCLLSACSHAGLVDEGLCYFNSMGSIYSISPTVEHYACMVDLLGRAGYLQEAEGFISMLPSQASPSLWRSLLGACRFHGDVDMGECIAKRLLELDPRNAAGYVLQSSVYTAAGKWDLSATVQQQRKWA